MSNRRTGKVASLPVNIREQINNRLRDGVTYEPIVRWLASEGFDYFNEQNISNWFKGGYEDWLADQKMIETASARAKASVDLVRELKKDGDVHITEANELMLAAQVNDALRKFDGNGLTTLLSSDPKKFFDLAMTVTAQSSERTKREKLELDFKKYRDKVEEQKRKIEDALAAGKKEKGGLTKEALAQIEQAAAML